MLDIKSMSVERSSKLNIKDRVSDTNYINNDTCSNIHQSEELM